MHVLKNNFYTLYVKLQNYVSVLKANDKTYDENMWCYWFLNFQVNNKCYYSTQKKSLDSQTSLVSKYASTCFLFHFLCNSLRCLKKEKHLAICDDYFIHQYVYCVKSVSKLKYPKFTKISKSKYFVYLQLSWFVNLKFI